MEKTAGNKKRWRRAERGRVTVKEGAGVVVGKNKKEKKKIKKRW